MVTQAEDAATDEPITRDQIGFIQEALNELGYTVGPVDGFVGRRTRQAIREFQADHGLELTARPSGALLRRVRQALAQQGSSSGTGEGTDDARGEGTRDPAPVPFPDSHQFPHGIEETGPNAGDRTQEEQGPRLRIFNEEEELAALSETLPGSRWQFTDESGARMVLEFREDGEVEGPAVGGDWSWTIEDGQLIIRFDAGIGLTATRRSTEIRRNRMEGIGESSEGRSWDWQAERIDS